MDRYGRSRLRADFEASLKALGRASMRPSPALSAPALGRLVLIAAASLSPSEAVRPSRDGGRTPAPAELVLEGLEEPLGVVAPLAVRARAHLLLEPLDSGLCLRAPLAV